jgi:hypothetical protein
MWRMPGKGMTYDVRRVPKYQTGVKMKFYRPGLQMLTLAGAFLTSTVALAGYMSATQVSINVAGAAGRAFGDLGAARNSSDAKQRIGCEAFGPSIGVCFAEDSTETSKECVTTNVNLLAQIRSLRDDSHLDFSWDASGHCVEIGIANTSELAPPKQ